MKDANGLIANILTAARAEAIPEAWSGLWYVRKAHLQQPDAVWRGHKHILVPAGLYTHLYRITDETLYHNPPGEVVMEDTPVELRTHLQFMLKAYGRVLITGLGLGCVVRGVLANPNVTEVVCIEKSPDVLKLVQPYMPTGRLEIIEADALEWTKSNRLPFDCAWHDIWSDKDAGQPHLDRLHIELLFNCKGYTSFQGAWRLDRRVRSIAERRLNVVY